MLEGCSRAQPDRAARVGDAKISFRYRYGSPHGSRTWVLISTNSSYHCTAQCWARGTHSDVDTYPDAHQTHTNQANKPPKTFRPGESEMTGTYRPVQVTKFLARGFTSDHSWLRPANHHNRPSDQSRQTTTGQGHQVRTVLINLIVQVTKFLVRGFTSDHPWFLLANHHRKTTKPANHTETHRHT